MVLPEADGGVGELTYSLTGLPEGLSFDADTRILSGIVPAGKHTLVYTATDEAGVQATFSFTITVGPALRTSRNTDSEDINWRRPHVRSMAVGRKQYSGPSAPGFTVTWNAPDMSSNTNKGFENLTLADIEHYELRYTKTGTGQWFAGTISRDSTSVAVPGLEAASQYHVRMRVKYSGARYTEWSFANASGHHTTNNPPKLASGSLNPTYILEWGGNDSVQRIDDDFTDPNGDTLTYSVSSTPAGIVTATIDTDGATSTLRIHLLNPITGAANVTYGAHDGYGGYVFQVISVGGFANMTRDIAEDAAAGDAVGAPVRGTPYGAERLYYTLTGEAATSGLFEIDSSTGQISVAEGATLDHEAKSSYTGKVKWAVNGQAAEVNLTINVTDGEEPPLAPVNPQVTSITDTGFTVTWEAPDNTGRTAITEFELTVEKPDSTVTTHKTPDGSTHSISLSDLQPGTTYDLTLKARNTDGDGPEVEFTGTTTDSRPRSADFTKYFRNGENAAFSQSDFPFSSDEENDVLASVKLTSIPTSEGAFRLNGSALAVNSSVTAANLGNLTFVPVTNFDGTATAQFKVIDQEGDESADAYTLTLRQVANIPPSFGAGPLSREIPENSTSSTAVGAAVTANDPDTGDTLVYSLTGTDAGSFTINGLTGQISVAAGTVLDYEADKNTYEVQVSVSDGKADDGTADTAVDATVTVNISVTNVNEGAPPAVDFTISEVKATSVLVTVTPPDTGSTSPIKRYVLSYTNTSAPTDFGFAGIESGTTATLTGLTPSTAYTVRVLAHNMDGVNGPVTSKTVTTGTNTAPASANFTKEVTRHAGATFSAGDFPFTDADPGDSLSKVKIVAMAMGADIYGKRPGELRFDGAAVTAGQEIAADDLGKLKYVPHPDGRRPTFGASFTFKVLDGVGAESPTYTATLKQTADIVLTMSPDSITESSTPSSGGRVTVTATLTGPVRTTDTVIPQIRVDDEYDARETSDYTVANNAPQLTIPAGQKGSSLTLDFTGIEDFLIEGDEEIKIYADWIINLINTTPRELVRPVLYLTLQDDDHGTVSITGPAGEVEEGENAVFTVTLSRGTTRPLSVAWSASSGTASADDFIGSSGTVTFPGGSPDNATQTITIPITDDLAPESTERFSVALGALTGKPASQVSIESGKGTANADIAENDAVTVSVSGDERVTEGESATYTISLDSAAPTQAITVDYTTIDKTAFAGTDYTAASGSVTIPAGQTSATTTVATTDNENDEANRYFEFRMSNPQGGGGLTPLLSTTQFVNTTIVDNDGLPSSIVLSVDKTSFGESEAAGTVNVTATLEGGTLPQNATVAVTLGGTATKGSTGDYTATTLGNITINTDQASGSASFTVTPVQDQVVEGDETIELKGAVAHLDVTPATITITDDDTATLGITADAGVVTEGSNAEFTVTLSHEVASQVVVAWSASSTATSSAASADDYSPDSGSVIFPAGSAAGATKKITMAIADDGTDEEQETFTVTLGDVTGDLSSRVSVDSAKSSADASIATGEIVTVSLLGPRSFPHVSNIDFAVYQVFLSGPVNSDIQVDVKTSNGTATGCDGGVNACSGGQTGDYVKVSKTLTIGPSKDSQWNTNDLGVTWFTVFVYFVSNSIGDADETFTISLSNLRGGGTTPVVLGNSSVTTTITSTDLTFSVSGPEFVNEGTNARFVISRNADLHPTQGARVSYTTKDGTATAGSDYTAVSGTLEMAHAIGDHSTDLYRQRYSDWEILVPILADNVDESDETFSLVLSNPERFNYGWPQVTAGLLGTDTATTTISDRAMVVSVSGPETVVEGQNADFTVTLSRAPTANLTVSYQTYGALPPQPSASSGEDYTAQSGTLTFVAGETSKRVRVPILTDAVTERIEYFRLLLSGPSGGGGLTPTLGTSEATMGIVDAAGPLYGATLTLTPASDIGEGNASTTEYTVKVDLDCCTTFEDPIAVTMSLGGTATIGDDYTANTVNVTIPASTPTATATTTLSITPVDDTIAEGNETIIVNGSAPGLAIIPTVITLVDNDTADITLSVDPEYVQEGQLAKRVTLTATRNGTSGDHTIDLSVGGGTATDGTDYTIWTFSPAPRIAPGETSTTFALTFTVNTDNEDEGNETVILSGTSPGATVSDAMVTIGQPESITLSVSPDSIVEDAADTQVMVTATMSAARDTDTTVNLTLGGTAAEPADYSAESLASITIPKGQTTADGMLKITPVDDTVAEGDETITVSGESGARPVASAEITITDNETANITLSVSPEYIQEGQLAKQVVVTATRDGTEGEHTVSLSVSDLGTAIGWPVTGADYVLWSLYDITIESGETSGSTTLTFTVIDDNVDEGNETIVLAGTAPGATVSDAVIIIGNPETITLSVSPDTIAEYGGATEVTVTATLSEARDADTVVDLTLGGTAASPVDYTATSLASITIPQGETSADGTLTVTPVDDLVEDDGETIQVAGASGARTVSPADITIAENPAVITLSVDPEYIQEGQQAARVTLTATRDSTAGDHTIDLSVGGGTATDGIDYTIWTFSPAPRIAPGKVSVTFILTFTVNTDNEDEGNETVILSGTAPGAVVRDAVVTIGNPESITLSVSPDSISEGDGATVATVTATLSEARAADTTVDLTLGGTATDPADYTATSLASITIPKGQTSADGTLTITPVEDTVLEVDETITVSGSSGPRPVSPADITLTDNFTDDPAYPDSYTLTASPTTVGEGAGATQITFTATLDDGRTFPGPVEILVYVEGEHGAKGTAGLNEDYTVVGSHGTFLLFSIPAGEGSATGTLTLTPVDDSVVEGEETAVFTSLAGGRMTTSGRPSITLTDNDRPSSITLSVSPSVLREGSSDTVTDVTVTATLSGGATLSGPTEVEVSLEDGTANSEDYSKATVTVTIPAGQSSGSANLKVTVTDDDKSEPDETLNVTGTAAPFTVHPAQITILDDDSGRRGIVLTVSPNRVREDAGATVLSVTASLVGMEPLKADAPIGLSLADGTATLADGTATLAGGDYSAATGTLTIPAGQLSGTGTFTFTPTKDAVVESDETVLLNAVIPRNLGRAFPTTITIINTSYADLSLSGPSAAVAEGASATFTATLSAAISEELSVAWLARPNTAVAADYSPASGSVTFPAGSAAGATQTFTVTNDGRQFVGGIGELHRGAGNDHLARQRLRGARGRAPSSPTLYIAESDPITPSRSPARPASSRAPPRPTTQSRFRAASRPRT